MTTRQISISAQPVTVAEAKLHLRIDQSLEDSLIEMWIAAATADCEQRTGRAIARAAYQIRLDTWPADVRLLWPPIVSVDSVKYVDAAGTVQILAPSEYVTDAHSEPGWIIPIAGWPVIGDYANAIEINYTAGYGPDAPEAIQSWILLQVGHWARNREIATDKPLSAVPYADGLLDRWRVY